MRELSTFPEVYVCRRFVDFRKQIDGLAQVVSEEMKLSVFTGALFVFMGRRKDRIKILYWDRTGFSLWTKRLEEAKFSWPRGNVDKEYVVWTTEELRWLLTGIDVWKLKPHRELSYEKIV